MVSTLRFHKVVAIGDLDERGYFRLHGGESCVLQFNAQMLRVIEGTVSVSIRNNGYILEAGDALVLMPGGDDIAVISPLDGAQMVTPSAS